MIKHRGTLFPDKPVWLMIIPDHSLGKHREKQLEITNQSSLQECVWNRVQDGHYASCRCFRQDTEVLAVQTHSCNRMSFILNQQCKIQRMRATSALPFKHTIKVESWGKPICQTVSLWQCQNRWCPNRWQLDVDPAIYPKNMDGIPWPIPILQICS